MREGADTVSEPVAVPMCGRWLVVTLPIDDLLVDLEHYQRPLMKVKVQRLVERWVEEAAKPPLVSRRVDGSHYVMDGQHTTAARKTRGETTVVCLVAEGLSLAQEAEVFAQNGNASKPSPLMLHKALVVAEAQEALEVEAFLAAEGFRLERSVQPFALQCAGTIWRLWKDNKDGLAFGLRMLRLAWGGRQSQAAIDGLAFLFEVFGAEIDQERMWRKLKAETEPANIRKLVEAKLVRMGDERSRSRGYALAIGRIYNSNLKSLDKRLNLERVVASGKKSQG